jgi:hypothetical protein
MGHRKDKIFFKCERTEVILRCIPTFLENNRLIILSGRNVIPRKLIIRDGINIAQSD